MRRGLIMASAAMGRAGGVRDGTGIRGLRDSRYLPGGGFFYNPFGWGFYSPVVVYHTPIVVARGVHHFDGTRPVAIGRGFHNHAVTSFNSGRPGGFHSAPMGSGFHGGGVSPRR